MHVKYNCNVMVHHFLDVCAPQYLSLCSDLFSDLTSRQHLCSTASRHLAILSHYLSMYGHQAFAVAALMMHNSLPAHLARRTAPCHLDDNHNCSFLGVIFQHIRGFGSSALYKSMIYITLHCMVCWFSHWLTKGAIIMSL